MSHIFKLRKHTRTERTQQLVIYMSRFHTPHTSMLNINLCLWSPSSHDALIYLLLDLSVYFKDSNYKIKKNVFMRISHANKMYTQYKIKNH